MFFRARGLTTIFASSRGRGSVVSRPLYYFVIPEFHDFHEQSFKHGLGSLAGKIFSWRGFFGRPLSGGCVGRGLQSVLWSIGSGFKQRVGGRAAQVRGAKAGQSEMREYFWEVEGLFTGICQR